MEEVGRAYRTTIPASPPSALTKQLPIMGEIVKGWVLSTKGTIVWGGSRGCVECGGTSGEKENECSEECSFRCHTCPWAKHDPSTTPNWMWVGLWPDKAYAELGLQEFFASAAKQRTVSKKQRGEHALEVAWSYAFGFRPFKCMNSPLADLPQKYTPLAFEKLLEDFAAAYAPGMKDYPGSECVVNVTNQSVVYLKQFVEEHGDNPSHTLYRAPIGTRTDELMNELRNNSLASSKAKTLISSEYWPIFKTTLLPTNLVKVIEDLVGGKKKAAAVHAEATLTRLEAAAIYDRITRKMEFEEVFETNQAYEKDLDAIKTARFETKGDLPLYPKDTDIHAYSVMVDIVTQDTKVCKKLGNAWRTVCLKTVAQSREKMEDALLKLVDKTEKVGTKTTKALLKSKLLAADKWMKKARKTLDQRCKPFQKGCSTMEYATDISRDNPQYAGWAVDLKMSEKYVAAYRAQEEIWKGSIPKLANADLKMRKELMSMELDILEKVRVAREPNFVKNCKVFEKQQRKQGDKKYKFDATQPEAAFFLNEQEMMKIAHERWFTKMKILLKERHDTAIALVKRYYSELQEVVYPLHSLDHLSSSEWATDHATSSNLKSIIANRTHRRTALAFIADDPLNANPRELLELEPLGENNDIEDKHPALLIMMAKVANGQITQDEYDTMLQIHNNSFSEIMDESIVDHDESYESANNSDTDRDTPLSPSTLSEGSDAEYGLRTDIAPPLPDSSPPKLSPTRNNHGGDDNYNNNDDTDDGDFKGSYRPIEYAAVSAKHRGSLKKRSSAVLILDDDSSDDEVYDNPNDTDVTISGEPGNPFTTLGKPGNPFDQHQHQHHDEEAA